LLQRSHVTHVGREPFAGAVSADAASVRAGTGGGAAAADGAAPRGAPST
jgi:hypothetical protein